MQKLTVAEYCRKLGIADSTARHRIKTGKLQSEMIDGLLYIVVDDDEVEPTPSEQIYTLVEAQKGEIEFL
jgi:predicted site-specific integrase-resolvase